MHLLIRKSQMNLFDHHEEQRTVHSGTRHLQNGAAVQVVEHQRRTEVVNAPAHAITPKVYSAPLVTREKVAALVNDFLSPLNITFEYGKSTELRGAQGRAFLIERRIITRKDATIDTLAHEISHIVQYDLRGDTRCSSDRQAGALGSEHIGMTKEYVAKLQQNKLGYLFQKANGITWRTMNQDIGAGIAPDPRIAQADREYAEWQAQQSPKKLYHAGADIPTGQLNSDTYWTHDKEVAEKGYLHSRPEVSKLHEADFHGDKPAGDDVVTSTAKRLGFDQDDLEGYTPASAFDKQLFPAHLVDRLKAELSRQGYSHIEATDITPPGRYQKEFKAIIPLAPVKQVTKSLSLTHLLRKSKEKHHRQASTHHNHKTGAIYQAQATMATVNVSDKTRFSTGTVEDIASLYRHVVSSEKGKRQWKGIVFGRVTNQAAKKIIGTTGLNVRSYRHAVSTDSFVHVFNRHGVGNENGDTNPVTELDIKRIPDIVENFDKVERGRSEGGLPTILYTKKYESLTYYVEEVQPMAGQNLLITKTMYKHAVQGQRATPSTDGVAHTSETSLNLSLGTTPSAVFDAATISPPAREINKSLAGGYLLKSSQPSKTALAGNQSAVGRELCFPTTSSAIVGITDRPMFDLFTANRQLEMSDHNNLQKSDSPSAYIKPAPQNDIRHLPALLKAARTLHGRIDFNGLQVSVETGRSRSRTWTNPDDGSMGIDRMKGMPGFDATSILW